MTKLFNSFSQLSLSQLTTAWARRDAAKRASIIFNFMAIIQVARRRTPVLKQLAAQIIIENFHPDQPNLRLPPHS